MKITLKVEGMTCNHCEKAINDTLTALNGVNTVEVHLKEGTVNVTYSEEKVEVSQMVEAIEEQGYDVAS